MRACPHRAICVVEHLGGNRAEEESPKRATSVGGHHDEVRVISARSLDDQLRGIAAANDTLNTDSTQLIGANSFSSFCRAATCSERIDSQK